MINRQKGCLISRAAAEGSEGRVLWRARPAQHGGGDIEFPSARWLYCTRGARPSLDGRSGPTIPAGIRLIACGRQAGLVTERPGFDLNDMRGLWPAAEYVSLSKGRRRPCDRILDRLGGEIHAPS